MLKNILGGSLFISKEYIVAGGSELDCFNPPVRGTWIHVSGGNVNNAPTGYTGTYCWYWATPGSGDCLAFVWSIMQQRLWIASFHGTSHTGTWKEISLT